MKKKIIGKISSAALAAAILCGGFAFLPNVTEVRTGITAEALTTYSAEYDGNGEYYGSGPLQSFDKILVHFTMEKNGYIDPKLEYIKGTSWTQTIYSGTGNNLENGIISTIFGVKSTDTTGKTGKIPLAKGEYTVELTAGHSSNNYYQVKSRLNIQYADNWETELNDIKSQADVIKSNINYNGTTMSDNDQDYFKFTLTETSNVKLYVANNSSCSWNFNVSDASNNVLNNTLTDQGDMTVASYGDLKKGTYYICIKESFTNYPTATPYKFYVKTTPVKEQTVAVTSIKLNKTSATLKKGGTLTLTPTIAPANAVNKTVTWTSSNTSVAAVSNGKVTAKAAGTATITAKTNNGKTASCKITVTADLINNATVTSAVLVGNSVKIYGKASGGKAPYTYKYMYKRTANSVWNYLGENKFVSETSKSFKPTSAAVFDVKVIVKDSLGNQTEKTFKTRSVDLKNNSAISAKNAKVGQKVTINGKASGSSEYKYTYMYKKENGEVWKTLGEAKTTNTKAVFKPAGAGIYDIKVIVTDKNGLTKSKIIDLRVD